MGNREGAGDVAQWYINPVVDPKHSFKKKKKKKVPGDQHILFHIIRMASKDNLSHYKDNLSHYNPYKAIKTNLMIFGVTVNFRSQQMG